MPNTSNSSRISISDQQVKSLAEMTYTNRVMFSSDSPWGPMSNEEAFDVALDDFVQYYEYQRELPDEALSSDCNMRKNEVIAEAKVLAEDKMSFYYLCLVDEIWEFSVKVSEGAQEIYDVKGLEVQDTLKTQVYRAFLVYCFQGHGGERFISPLLREYLQDDEVRRHIWDEVACSFATVCEEDQYVDMVKLHQARLDSSSSNAA